MMNSFRVFIISIFLTFTFLEITLALSGNGEICQKADNVTSTVNGTVTTTITKDTCDPVKNLECLGGRCACKDQAHMIWTSREFKVKRSKRSPSPGKGGKSKSKGSTGKAVAAGAAAGVAGGIAGYAIAKGVDGATSGGGSSGSGSGSSHNHGSSHKVVIWSCYSRVGGDCVIDPSRTTLITKTTTTIDASGNTTTVNINEAVDYSSYPKCVQGAECKTKRISGGTDSNIGECVCKDGYKKNKIDICESGVDKLTITGMIFSILLAHFFVQK